MKNKPILADYKYEIELEDDSIEVDFVCEFHVENDGIGSYNYWGSTYYDAGDDYLVLDYLKWDESKFSKEQNEAIRSHIEVDDNWFKIEERASQEVYGSWEEDYYGYEEHDDYLEELGY